jgi:hypothetical protein
MKTILKQKSNAGVSGMYRFRTYVAGTKKLKRVSPWIKNLVVSSANRGVNLLIKGLQGDDTYPIEITQAKIGTGTTPAADADTDLGNIVLAGIPVAVFAEDTNEQLTIQFFIVDGDLANGTYNEFGIFCGARLFARSIISPAYFKGANEDTEVDYVINVNN